MKKLTAFFKRIRLVQVLTVFLAGVLLLTSTACNNGDLRGARPQNPPVQAGGQNNPHKGGGDPYTNYKMSTDPNVNTAAKTERKLSKPGVTERDHADLTDRSDRIENQGNSGTNASKLLYPGSAPLETDKDGTLLEKAGATFKDATHFIREGVE